ncbi:MAG: ATP-binding protein [Acidimicrobiales bacterium]
MGWSIHRLRGLLGTGHGRPVDLDAVGRELDELTAAKDRLSRMLASDVLHEGDGEGRGEGGRGIAATETDRRASLAEVVAEVCDQLATEAEREGVRLSMQVDDPAAAAGPASPALVDVVFNLVDNAIDAATSQVVVALGAADGAAEATTVRVLDDGAGLSPADAVHAFEPFFTTKPDGTGMGLAIADALVGELGGDLRHDRVDDRTVFTVSVPRPREVVEEPDRVAKRPA